MYDYSFTANKRIYSPEVVTKAAFAFIDRAYVHIGDDGDSWIIDFSWKNGHKEQGIDQIRGEFENELISQAVRYNVFKRTHTVRELLFARAITSTLIEEDDPVERIESDQENISDDELKNILTDWFNHDDKR